MPLGAPAFGEAGAGNSGFFLMSGPLQRGLVRDVLWSSRPPILDICDR